MEEFFAYSCSMNCAGSSTLGRLACGMEQTTCTSRYQLCSSWIIPTFFLANSTCKVYVEVILEKNTIADTGPWFVRIRNSDIEMSKQLVSEKFD